MAQHVMRKENRDKICARLWDFINHPLCTDEVGNVSLHFSGSASRIRERITPTTLVGEKQILLNIKGPLDILEES